MQKQDTGARSLASPDGSDAPVEVSQGSLPIVLSLPHSGTHVPEKIWQTLTSTGQMLSDTDWHIDRLYNRLGLDLSVIRAAFHPIVMDVNQDPDSVHDVAFDQNGDPLYRAGAASDAAEQARRVEAYHRPYHAALSTELARLRSIHGVVLLYDCHSRRSFIPKLEPDFFEDLNIATNLSQSCAPIVERTVHTRCRAAAQYSCALNQLGPAGWITQTYGQPAQNIHAIEITLAQRTYMDEVPPWRWRADKADQIRSLLYRMLNDLSELVLERQLR